MVVKYFFSSNEQDGYRLEVDISDQIVHSEVVGYDELFDVVEEELVTSEGLVREEKT